MPNVTTFEESELLQEIISMCNSTRTMLELTWEGFRTLNAEKLIAAENLGREIHRKEKQLTELAIAVLSKNEGTVGEFEKFSLLPSHLERIGDNIELLIRCTNGTVKEGICYSDKAINEINTLFGKSIELLESLTDTLIRDNKMLLTHVLEDSKNFNETVSEYSLWHYDRMLEGNCIPKASSSFLAMLDYFSDIVRHIREMAKTMDYTAANKRPGTGEREKLEKNTKLAGE